MWHIPESAFKRGAMGLFMAAIALLGPFLNHPSKDELGYISTVLVFATCGLKMINPKAKNVTKGFDTLLIHETGICRRPKGARRL
jgi:hypothetical protein